MKKLIVFDLDGTLAESKAFVDMEMANLLHVLLGMVKVSAISGGDWLQFEKQVLASGGHLCCSAGVMVLSEKHPREIRYRSAEPILVPVLPQECIGTIANVVFPTGIDRRDDLGSPDRFDVYYGMADNRIGVARLNVPSSLPAGGVGAQPKAKV